MCSNTSSNVLNPRDCCTDSAAADSRRWLPSLLSSSTESTNLLQYDSDFCSKRFRACELVKGNLSSFEMSLKGKYDVDAVERYFKSGEKALALFPVPRDKLNSRFFGHYITEKRRNDLKSEELIMTGD